MKLFIDILLFVLMILEFSRSYLPTIIHEIIGIILLILVIIHLVLNRNYIKNIFRGKYNLKRISMFIINIVFMITFILSCLFGILSSNELVPFLNISNINIISLHKIMAYVSLIFMGIHLGVNFKAFFGNLAKRINNKVILNLIKFIIILFGIYSWFKLDFWKHLTGTYGFSVVTDNLFINILEYLSIIMLFSIITNSIFNIKERRK